MHHGFQHPALFETLYTSISFWNSIRFVVDVERSQTLTLMNYIENIVRKDMYEGNLALNGKFLLTDPAIRSTFIIL